MTDFWSDARVAEEARLESVYASKAHRGFESPSLRKEGALDENPEVRYRLAAFSERIPLTPHSIRILR